MLCRSTSIKMSERVLLLLFHFVFLFFLYFLHRECTSKSVIKGGVLALKLFGIEVTGVTVSWQLGLYVFHHCCLLPHRTGAGVMEADDCQVTTVFTV